MNRIFISSANAREISTKHRLGKLPGAAQLVRIGGWVRKAQLSELPISIAHAQRAGGWPQVHRDPFDRMLAAQSAVEDLPLISRDPTLEGFGVRLVW